MLTQRQGRALGAVRAIAAGHGLHGTEPRLLSDCNNVIVHLAPWPVVAKVADTSCRPAAAARLQRELDVGLHLARAGAPAVPPSGELPGRLHTHGGQVVTFWRYQEEVANAAVDPGAVAGSLREVHRALETYRGELPPFRPLPGLPHLDASEPEAALLLREHTRLTVALRDRVLRRRPLHGDPHRGNVLVNPGGCLWIDFESSCAGPVEWDLSALPADEASSWADVDCDLLALLRRVRSVRTVIWCRTRAGSGPAVERAAAAHLDLLRAA